MKTLDVIKKAVEVIRGPMELRPRQIIISEEVLNTIAADILGQQREIEKLKGKLAISKSIARHYRKDARVLLKEQEAKIEHLKRPDCEHAEHDGTGCLGYCYCGWPQDDEPIEECKRCGKYTGNISDGG